MSKPLFEVGDLFNIDHHPLAAHIVLPIPIIAVFLRGDDICYAFENPFPGVPGWTFAVAHKILSINPDYGFKTNIYYYYEYQLNGSIASYGIFVKQDPIGMIERQIKKEIGI